MARSKIISKAPVQQKAAQPSRHLTRPAKVTRQAQGTLLPTKSSSAPDRLSGQPARPAGKLGVLIDRLATESGATADELAAATGWQKHTVVGALSRLRSRGFVMRLEPAGDRKAYRLVAPEAGR
jgi:Fic family protein